MIRRPGRGERLNVSVGLVRVHRVATRLITSRGHVNYKQHVKFHRKFRFIYKAIEKRHKSRQKNISLQPAHTG
jgi:hypothetical protein